MAHMGARRMHANERDDGACCGVAASSLLVSILHQRKRVLYFLFVSVSRAGQEILAGFFVAPLESSPQLQQLQRRLHLRTLGPLVEYLLFCATNCSQATPLRVAVTRSREPFTVSLSGDIGAYRGYRGSPRC